MKASELRIGNIVGTPIGISRVLEVSELWIYAEPINYDGGSKIIELSKVKPVPLHYHTLERFGFEIDKCDEVMTIQAVLYLDDWFSDAALRSYVLDFDKRKQSDPLSLQFEINYYQAGYCIDSFNRLQNFYFALTGEELTYEATK